MVSNCMNISGHLRCISLSLLSKDEVMRAGELRGSTKSARVTKGLVPVELRFVKHFQPIPGFLFLGIGTAGRLNRQTPRREAYSLLP